MDFKRFFRNLQRNQHLMQEIGIYKGEKHLMTGLPGRIIQGYNFFACTPLRPLEREIAALREKLLLLGFFSLGFTSLLGLVLARKFLVPIRELSLGLASVKERRFSHKIPPRIQTNSESWQTSST